jgi:hypothetical protein
MLHEDKQENLMLLSQKGKRQNSYPCKAVRIPGKNKAEAFCGNTIRSYRASNLSFSTPVLKI